MKKVIKGKLYDTETAKLVGEYDNGKFTNDFGYFSEDLYLKRTGEFFIFGFGGFFTKYDGVKTITPVSYEDAKAWAEEHLIGEEYIEIFGEPEESTDKMTISLSLTEIAVAKLKQGAAKTGMSMSGYVESLIK
mgnify:CR=1 FL=1